MWAIWTGSGARFAGNPRSSGRSDDPESKTCQRQNGFSHPASKSICDLGIGYSCLRALGNAGLFRPGAAAGILTGVVVGYFQLADDVARPLVAATYPIPKIAILPLLILWLSIGEGSKVAVIMLGAFFPVVINVRAGVRNVDPLLIKAALSLGSGPFNVIRKVILPMTLPMIFAGLKLGVGIALLLVVTAEMIAADKGLGFLILSSADLMQTTRLLFGIMVLSGMGVSFAWILEKLERLLLPWRE